MKKLVVIHGALGNAAEMETILSECSSSFDIYFVDILGHGSSNDAGIDFNYDSAIADLKTKIAAIGSCVVFGFSFGGYLALQLAQEQFPYIAGIVTLGTKLNWNKDVAIKETAQLDLTRMKEFVPDFYQHLLNIHGQRLTVLTEYTKSMMMDLGNKPRLSHEALRNVTIPIRIIRGGKDKMVSKEESLEVVQLSPYIRYFEVPHFIHPISFLKPKHVVQLLNTHVGSLDYCWLATSIGEIAYRKIVPEIQTESITVLFLHEALGSIAQWKDFPNQLCEALGATGIVLELIGYGYSDAFLGQRDQDYLKNFSTNLIPEIITKLAISNQILLVGHSDGGTNALFLAKFFPNTFCGVVTMAAHCMNELETKSGIAPAISAYKEGKLLGLEVYHGQKTEKVFFDWADTWLSDAYSEWDIVADIQGIELPGLIIQGDLDQYGTMKQVDRIVDSFNAPVVTFIPKNVGHAPHLEIPSEVINEIKAWKEKYL